MLRFLLFFYYFNFLYFLYYKMLDLVYMKKVQELLKESDRMDLWEYAFEKDKPETPTEFVVKAIADHPEKKVRVEKYLRVKPF